MNPTAIQRTTRQDRKIAAAPPVGTAATRRALNKQRIGPRVSVPLLETHNQMDDLQCVRVRYFHPTAGEVNVAGTFNNWNPTSTAMLRQPDGTWFADLILAPGVYEYRFYADGQWHDDPKAAAFVPNPYGGVNAVLQVGRLQ